jgi:hypothetical protein
MIFQIGDIRIVEGKFNSVFVSRKSIIDGQPYTMCLGNVGAREIYDWFKARLSGDRRLIQDVFPNLLDEEREFLISGITPGEWDRKIAITEDEEPDTTKESE